MINGHLEEGEKIVWSRLVLLEEDAHSCAIIKIVTITITIVIIIKTVIIIIVIIWKTCVHIGHGEVNSSLPD